MLHGKQSQILSQGELGGKIRFWLIRLSAHLEDVLTDGSLV